MGYDRNDYYAECVSDAAEQVGLALTAEQAESIGKDIAMAVECEGMSFYTPPSSERYEQIEREWESKFKALQREFDAYRNNAETAVKVALRQHGDAHVSIGENGEVRRHDGRSDRIQ